MLATVSLTNIHCQRDIAHGNVSSFRCDNAMKSTFKRLFVNKRKLFDRAVPRRK